MADYTVTPANVLPGATAVLYSGTAGEAIDPGESCYLDAADNKVKLADANGAAAANAAVRGIAANQALVDGSPIRLVTGGPLAIGTGTRGDVVVQSANPGKLAPVADLASGHYVTTLGVVDGSSNLIVRVHASGVQV